MWSLTTIKPVACHIMVREGSAGWRGLIILSGWTHGGVTAACVIAERVSVNRHKIKKTNPLSHYHMIFCICLNCICCYTKPFTLSLKLAIQVVIKTLSKTGGNQIHLSHILGEMGPTWWKFNRLRENPIAPVRLCFNHLLSDAVPFCASFYSHIDPVFF